MFGFSGKAAKAVGALLFFLPLAVIAPSRALAGGMTPASGCSVFDPTPDDRMRSFSTDRPTKSDSPYTVDCGHFQYESDIVNWTYDRYNGSSATTSNFLAIDPVLKLGLTRRTDLEFALAPINIDHSHDRAAGTESSAFGFGDIYTRLKINIFGDDGGNYALAVVPYVKAPTADYHIGNRHWEGGGYMPFVAVLPNDFTLNVTTELDILENAALDGDHANFINLINISHPAFDPSVTGYVEFWSDVNDDAGAPTQYTLDFAASWLVTPNWQLDGGVNFGLNKAAPDFQPYIGVSQRF